MSKTSEDGAVIVVAIVAAIFLASVWKLSQALGASFQVTLDAALHSIPVLIVATLVLWLTDFSILPILGVALALIWPQWWEVIGSIACDGNAPHECFMPKQPWWDSGWTRWGVEFALIGLAIWLILRNRDS
ncbi:MAG: hypothetical protein FDZ72_08820 [Betaproteobacteria bacterium]|nr:MAG: hypothetical protein FDZ72_08820 [Betaproteobacteria bacterium]